MGWALYGVPERIGVDVCQFWPEGTGAQTDKVENRAGGDEGPKETKGRRGRRRRAEGGTKKPSRMGWALYGIPERVGVDVCQFWPETGENRSADRQGREPGRRTGGNRTGGSRTGPEGTKGQRRRKAGGDEGPKETKGRRGRRRRAEGGNMKKPNRMGWALYGIPDRVGVDVCQFWPETEGNRTEDRQGGGSGTGTGGRRLRSPKRGQRRRGWQRLTP